MLLTNQNEKHTADFMADLHLDFEMSNLGLLHHYLGVQFKQCDGGIALWLGKVYRDIATEIQT